MTICFFHIMRAIMSFCFSCELSGYTIMTCELGDRLNIPPNSAMFGVGHLLILVVTGRMGSTFKCHSACKCTYTLSLLTRDFSSFAAYQR